MLQKRLEPEFSTILVHHVGIRRIVADLAVTTATVYSWGRLGMPLQWFCTMYAKYPEIKFWEMFPKFDKEFFKNLKF